MQAFQARFTGGKLDKKKLSEADICENFITPAIQQAGWDTLEQIYREYTLRPAAWLCADTRQAEQSRIVT